MNDGLSRRSEQTSSAYKNARFVPNDKDFYLFFCDKMPLKEAHLLKKGAVSLLSRQLIDVVKYSDLSRIFNMARRLGWMPC